MKASTSNDADIIEAIRQGESARDAGMLLASLRKRWRINHDTLRFLDVLIASPTLTATTDEAVDDLLDTYRDGGKWRGGIPKSLADDGLIVRVRVVRSTRKARHRGWVAQWRVHDRQLVDCRRAYLRDWLNKNPEPQTDEGDLFDSIIKTKNPALQTPGAY